MYKKSDTDTLQENHSWQIPINRNDFKIFKNSVSRLCEVLQNKFDCIATLVPPGQEGHSDSLQVFRGMVTPWLEVSVWKDDLTRHAVDVLVNAANEELIHGGGLAHALVKAGGFEIQEESRAYISKFGKIPTSGIAFTRAGRLPCKLIIHAVGPRWEARENRRCIYQLKRTITNILDYVTHSTPNTETVAIPALSSGIFQFPVDLCTKTIVETIRFYFRGNQQAKNLKEIHLVSNEDHTVFAFKVAAEIFLGWNKLGSSVTQETTPPINTMIVNNLTLQVVHGHIELQKTDVIVNSVHPCGGLRVGTVSKSILQQAGDEIEWEFRKKMAKVPQDSQLILVTEGFKLPCEYVFHVLWPSGYHELNMILKNVMKMCLKKCLELNKTSISFPALGIESFGKWKSTAAEIMFDEVLIFAKHHLKKQLTVKFVIFSEELDTFKAFKAKMANCMSKLQDFNNDSVFSVPEWTREEERENGLKVRSPAISLMGFNLESMREAQVWIQKILTLQDQHIIENNHILYLGKKEHDILLQLQRTSSVSISEIISPEKAMLEIKGAQGDLVQVVLNIEHMLCKVQEELAREKEQALWSLSGQWTAQQPKIQDEMKENTFLKRLMLSAQEIQDQKKQFESCGLQVIKVEKIDNAVLMAAFQGKKITMEERMPREPVSHRLFQHVPWQFCKVVCRVGFQRMYSGPCDPKYGAGIYFTKNLINLACQVKKTPATDKLIYVFEAEVLTGSFCQGHHLNIVPPPLSPGVIESHDSVVDNVSSPETFVIFSSLQAAPLYLWTCAQDHVQPQDYSSGPVMSPEQRWRKLSSGSPVD